MERQILEETKDKQDVTLSQVVVIDKSCKGYVKHLDLLKKDFIAALEDKPVQNKNFRRDFIELEKNIEGNGEDKEVHEIVIEILKFEKKARLKNIPNSIWRNLYFRGNSIMAKISELNNKLTLKIGEFREEVFIDEPIKNEPIKKIPGYRVQKISYNIIRFLSYQGYDAVPMISVIPQKLLKEFCTCDFLPESLSKYEYVAAKIDLYDKYEAYEIFGLKQFDPFSDKLREENGWEYNPNIEAVRALEEWKLNRDKRKSCLNKKFKTNIGNLKIRKFLDISEFENMN